MADPKKPRFTITLDNYLRREQDPFVRFEQDDVIPEEKDELAQHLVESTTDSTNNQSYPLTSGRIEKSIRMADGKPSPIETDVENQTTFIAQTDDSAESRFNANSNTGLLSSVNGLNVGVDIIKGKQNPKSEKSISLVDLLNNVDTNPNDNKLSRTVDAVIQQTDNEHTQVLINLDIVDTSKVIENDQIVDPLKKDGFETYLETVNEPIANQKYKPEPNSVQVELSIRNPDGTPATIETDVLNQSTFIATVNDEAEARFNTNSNTGLLSSVQGVNVGVDVVKGKKSSPSANSVEYDNLLREIDENLDDNTLSRTLDSVIERENEAHTQKLTDLGIIDTSTIFKNDDQPSDPLKADGFQEYVNQVNEPSANQRYKPLPNTAQEENSIRNPDGKPAQIVTAQGQTRGTFFSDTMYNAPEAITKFDSNSNTGMFDIDGENIGLNIIKGKQNAKNTKSISLDALISDENQVNGNIVSDTVFKRMEQTTRFNPNKTYLPNDGSATENTAGTKDFVIQNTVGVHSPFPPGFLGSGNRPGSEQYTITVDQLKNLGVQMMLKASGEYYLPKDEGSGESFKSLGSTLAPGLARIGQRVNYNDFRPSAIMDKVNENYNPTELPSLDANGPQKKSFGSPYNPVIPFDGFVSDTAALVSAGAMAAAISGVVLTLSAMFGSEKVQNFVRRRSNVTDGANNAYNYHEQHLGQNSLGISLPKQNDQGPGALIGGIVGDSENLLGLVATRSDFKKCVKKGLEVFFDPTERDSRNLILTSPNYANTILRNITRDIVDVGLGIANLAGNNNVKGSLEVNSWSSEDSRNSAGTVDASLRMLTQLKNNRAIKFMNIMAMLGDAIITGDKGYTYLDEADNALMKDTIDNEAIPSKINLANFHKKGRLSSGVNKGAGGTSWASNTITSMYIRPKEMEIASKTYLNNYNAVAQLTEQNYFKKPDTNSARLSQDYVEELERQLASAYMPFYFHDLRTNEIIAFHAFLDSIKDTFDADYTETEAYGRLGKTYKWKNTNRSVGLGFWLVSTSPQDFDEMWFKINKLVSLTMPQYTEGRKLSTTFEGQQVSFAQPFSQIPASSPLVRMRLGDLFTTNYSKFDLARMFGVGNESMFNVGNDQTISGSTSLEIRDSVYGLSNNVVIDLNKNRLYNGTTYILQQDFFCFGERNGKKIFRPVPTVPNQKDNDESTTNKMYILPAGTNVIYKGPSDGTFLPDSPPDAPYKFSINNIGDVYFGLNGMPASLLQPSMQEMNNLINQLQPSISARASTNTIIGNFFKDIGPNANPIFKGFESTKGEGMAGFVKNVNFDWDQSTVWGTDQNRKAPTMMKVSIEFLPIFDLNPGLDSNGFMIGAPYKVGNIMKSLKDPDSNRTPPAGT